MIKKEYQKPAMEAVRLNSHICMLTPGSIQTSGLKNKDNDEEPDLGYEKKGGNQRFAW